eukprot:5274564-Prymnesium_polylepis.2
MFDGCQRKAQSQRADHGARRCDADHIGNLGSRRTYNVQEPNGPLKFERHEAAPSVLVHVESQHEARTRRGHEGVEAEAIDARRAHGGANH